MMNTKQQYNMQQTFKIIGLSILLVCASAHKVEATSVFLNPTSSSIKSTHLSAFNRQTSYSNYTLESIKKNEEPEASLDLQVLQNMLDNTRDGAFTDSDHTYSTDSEIGNFDMEAIASLPAINSSRYNLIEGNAANNDLDELEFDDQNNDRKSISSWSSNQSTTKLNAESNEQHMAEQPTTHNLANNGNSGNDKMLDLDRSEAANKALVANSVQLQDSKKVVTANTEQEVESAANEEKIGNLEAQWAQLQVNPESLTDNVANNDNSDNGEMVCLDLPEAGNKPLPNSVRRKESEEVVAANVVQDENELLSAEIEQENKQLKKELRSYDKAIQSSKNLEKLKQEQQELKQELLDKKQEFNQLSQNKEPLNIAESMLAFLVGVIPILIIYWILDYIFKQYRQIALQQVQRV